MSTKLSCTWAELRGDARHAASCPSCAARAGFERALAAAMPAPGAVDVDRALGRAFAQRPAPVARRWPMFAGVAFAAAAVAAVLAWPRGGAHDDALPAGVATAVAHAQVTPEAGARVTIAGDHEVALVTGGVEVDVDPAPHAPFRVSTPRFAVDVLGTQFHVTLDSVVVSRGAVRVVSPDGSVIAARVAAGEAWHLGSVVASSADENQRRNDGMTERRNDGTEITNAGITTPPPQTATQPPTSTQPQTQPQAPTSPQPPTSTSAPKHDAHAKSAREHIADARNAITNHDVSGARKILDGVLASKLGAADRVDAERAYAESFIGNDPTEAEQRFEAIGDEAALFEAARLARKRGATDDEKRLLAAYLQRYPKGFMRSDAQKRLDALGATPK